MSLKDKIKSNAGLKRTAHFLLHPKRDARPRWWIRFFVNPFFRKLGKGAIIRSSVRLDTFPYNQFHLGNYSVIEDFSVINNAVGDVTIGKETIIGVGNVIIGPVEIGNNIMLAQHIVVSGLNHGYEDVSLPPRDQDVICKKILIEDNCWIGSNAVITAGVTIGKHSVVGAGSVITKDVPPYSVAAGNPARILKKFNHEINNWERV